MSTLQQEFSSLSIRQLCELLGVSRSWLYARPHAPSQAQRDVALRNAIAEVYLNHYETFADAEGQIGRFIDDVYNQKRLHSSLGYLPPVEYESLYTTAEEHPLALVR